MSLMRSERVVHRHSVASRVGLCLVTAICLFLSPISIEAGGTEGAAKQPDGGTARLTGYSLQLTPAEPFSFLRLLNVSLVGEDRYAGLGRKAVSDPSPYHSGGMDLLSHRASSYRSRSYIFSLENTAPDNPYIGLARVDRDDISRVSRISADEYRAELMIGYSRADLGSILFGKGMQLERPGDTSFKFLDDGWRLKFIKKF